jgi:PPM family protein phosphatase
MEAAPVSYTPSHLLRFDLGHATHAGMVRGQNEDSYCAIVINGARTARLHRPVLIAVADGMGGAEAGEVASSLSIRQIVEHTARMYTGGGKPSDEWIRASVSDINQRISDEARRRGHIMGSTLVAAVIHEGVAHLANVGDSRIYMWHAGDPDLTRLVRDHSLVQMLVDEGVIADQERYDHPRRNLITRSLGDPNTGVSDENPAIELISGDWLLLCSDGLWEMVRDEAIRDVLSKAKNAQNACDALIALANTNGGEDNVTVVIARAL